MNNPLFKRLQMAATEQELHQLRVQLLDGGYSSLYALIESFKHYLQSFQDDEKDHVLHMIAKASHILPVPGNISPSWQTIWDDLKLMAINKIKALHAIPIPERDGEWQIVIDNPQTITEVVCYPGLTFGDAVYLYGYFRPGLEPNEYIRLQKVQHALVEYGK